MMEVGSRNNIIYEQLKKCVLDENSYAQRYNDFDGVTYQILRLEDRISYSFKCNNFQNIFKIAGKQMLDKHYSDLKVDKTEQLFDITLSIMLDTFPLFKTDTEQLSREEVRKLKKEAIEQMRDIADRLGHFKQHFYSAPFDMILGEFRQGRQKALTYLVSAHFKVWLISLEDKVLIYFGLGFTDPTEHQLAKLILMEMEEAKRQVVNSPSIHMMHNDKIPPLLKQKFKNCQEDLDTYGLNNGLLEITLFPSHLDNQSQLVEYLQSFRLYLQYHMCNIKTYLHGRLRNKCQNMITTIQNSKIEDDFQI